MKTCLSLLKRSWLEHGKIRGDMSDCEERSDVAIQNASEIAGLLRFARNDDFLSPMNFRTLQLI